MDFRLTSSMQGFSLLRVNNGVAEQVCVFKKEDEPLARKALQAFTMPDKFFRPAGYAVRHDSGHWAGLWNNAYVAQRVRNLAVNPAREHVVALYEAVPASEAKVEQTFQQRVQDWMHECFGEKVSCDEQERNHRFLEEALELVQACGITASEAHQLVDYVFGRPKGEKSQEVGGVEVTLAALCTAHGIDKYACGTAELSRIWKIIPKIREKHSRKPRNSPLPQ